MVRPYNPLETMGRYALETIGRYRREQRDVMGGLSPNNFLSKKV